MGGGEALRCSVCKKAFKEEDMIMIDIIHMITHSECVHVHNQLPILYLGPFNYFKESCPHVNV